MVKRLQNKVSESRMTLPVVAIYAIGVWLLSGLIARQWWVQFGCFVVSTYLMVELNNANALIRIYSRMVSASFLVLSAAACFLFGNMQGAVAELCVIAAYTTLFRSYQDKTAVGWTFYTFLLLSLGSLEFVYILGLAPILWLLMAFKVQSLSWRTFWSSLLGLLTPYWFFGVYFIYQDNFDWLIRHFASMTDVEQAFDYSQLTAGQMASYAFFTLIAITGIVHYLRTRYNDKIRIRMIFDCFIIVDLLSIVVLAVQPQHYDMMLRMMIINTSPLIAHFIALTHTRITNWAFYAIAAAALSLTVFNLWMPL